MNIMQEKNTKYQREKHISQQGERTPMFLHGKNTFAITWKENIRYSVKKNIFYHERKHLTYSWKESG